MAVIAGLTNSFKKEILEGTHNLASGGDALKIALYKSSADLIPSTTAYSATGEVSSSDYTAEGSLLVNNGIFQSGLTTYLDFQDVAWSTVTFTGDGKVRGALIYNSSKSNKSIAVLDFGVDVEVSAGTFTVKFPTADANDAIIRIK